MKPPMDMDKRIDNGVELLNNVFKGPYWVDYISLKDLDMSSMQYCVLGELASYLSDDGKTTSFPYHDAAEMIEKQLGGEPETEFHSAWKAEYGFSHVSVGGEPEEGDYVTEEQYQVALNEYRALRETYGDCVDWTASTEYQFLTSLWRRKIAELYYKLHNHTYPEGWEEIDRAEQGLDPKRQSTTGR